MNGIIDKDIMAVLNIVNIEERIGASSDLLEDIKNSCNKDLRNALITLQLYKGSDMSNYMTKWVKKDTSKGKKHVMKDALDDFEDLDSNSFFSGNAT